MTQIQGGLSASADEIAWMQTAYLHGQWGDEAGTPAADERKHKDAGCEAVSLDDLVPAAQTG